MKRRGMDYTTRIKEEIETEMIKGGRERRRRLKTKRINKKTEKKEEEDEKARD